MATPIISPAKPATRNTRSRVLTQVGAGGLANGGNPGAAPGGYLLRVQTGCLLESEKTVVVVAELTGPFRNQAGKR